MILRYDALAAIAPVAYQANAAQYGISPEAALRLPEALWDALPGSRPTMQDELQKKIEQQATALKEDIRHQGTLLAADCKRPIKDSWRSNCQDIVQLLKTVQEAIEVGATGPSGLWKVRVLNSQKVLTEAHNVMAAD